LYVPSHIIMASNETDTVFAAMSLAEFVAALNADDPAEVADGECHGGAQRALAHTNAFAAKRSS
jgi:DNA-directed RNA polymerase subunit H (RpoH/RPB5)